VKQQERCARHEGGREKNASDLLFPIFRQAHDDTSWRAILSKIAQSTKDLSVRMVTISRSGFGRKTKVSNLDQLFLSAWLIIAFRDEHFFFSFRSSELSQPI
jgi:hypothetical protein